MRNNSLITIFLIVFLSFIHHACGSSDDYDNSLFLTETKNVLDNDDNRTKSALFVAVGDNATLISSSDGVTWTKRSIDIFSNNFSGVAYGNNIFVAIGDNGTIFSSSSGNTWTSRNSQTSNNLRGIVFGNNIFILTSCINRIR